MSDQFVQSGKASGSGTAVVVLNGVVAGNTLVAFGFNGQDAFPTLHSCADVPDGAYTAGVSGLDTSNSVFGQVFTKENCAAGTHTITFTTDVGEVCDLYVVEVTAPTSAAVAGTNAAGQSAPGTGANALASGAVTFTGAYTLVGFSTDSASVSAGNIPNVGTSPNSFTSRDSGTSSVIGAWRLETAAAATTAGATATAIAGGDNYVTLVAAVANGTGGAAEKTPYQPNYARAPIMAQ